MPRRSVSYLRLANYHSIDDVVDLESEDIDWIEGFYRRSIFIKSDKHFLRALFD